MAHCTCHRTRNSNRDHIPDGNTQHQAARTPGPRDSDHTIPRRNTAGLNRSEATLVEEEGGRQASHSSGEARRTRRGERSIPRGENQPRVHDTRPQVKRHHTHIIQRQLGKDIHLDEPLNRPVAQRQESACHRRRPAQGIALHVCQLTQERHIQLPERTGGRHRRRDSAAPRLQQPEHTAGRNHAA